MWRRSPRWDEVTYWALDLETTGLDPRRDLILSVGMLPVRRGIVRFAEAFNSLVRPPESAASSVEAMRAHHIVPGELAGAPVIEAVLPEILSRLGRDVLLVHDAALDVRLLRRSCREAGVAWPRPPIVDTVDLLWKRARVKRYLPGSHEGDPELNLALARRAIGLPDYPAHDALVDAVATAELFLALRHQLGARTLGDLR